MYTTNQLPFTVCMLFDTDAIQTIFRPSVVKLALLLVFWSKRFTQIDFKTTQRHKIYENRRHFLFDRVPIFRGFGD